MSTTHSTAEKARSTRDSSVHKRGGGCEDGRGRSRATAGAVAERAARRVEEAYAAELAHSGRGRRSVPARALRDAGALGAARASLRSLGGSPRVAAAPLRARAERLWGAGSADAGEPSRSTERRRWIALAVLCLGQLMMVLDATIVNVALPSIQRDLHFTQQNLTWVLNGYLITFGGFLLLAGRMGDLVGRKKVFLTGIVVFTAASILCGVASTQGMLIGARVLQGVGGAIASSVILAIIVTEFPAAAERARAMGVYAFVSAGGGSIGLLAGGVLTQSLDWHWIFFVNVPIGIVAFVLGSGLIAENAGIGLGRGVDVLGSALITLAATVGAYAIVKSTQYGLLSARTLATGGTSLALLAAFFALEARVSNPIMPLRVLRLRMLMGSSLVRGLLVTGMFSAFFLGSLYLERVLGYDAIQTGLAFLPLTAGIAVLSMGPAAKAVARFGAVRTLAVGLLVLISGLLSLAAQGTHAGYFPGLFVSFLMLGLGAGASFLPLLTLGMSEVPAADAGLASGIINVSVQLFGAMGLATLGTVATDHARALSADGRTLAAALTGGYHLAYLVAAACVALGIIAALLTLRPPAQRELQAGLEPEPAAVPVSGRPAAQPA
jgi:EmrB/QacA subfamily drug resistance transporter